MLITPKRIPEETKQRAIRLVLDHLDEYPNLTAGCETVSARLGFGAESLRRWVRQAQIDGRERHEVTSTESERMRRLGRENREVCGLVRLATVLVGSSADEKWCRQYSEFGPVSALHGSRESNEMRALRYAINVTLDGCCHHEAGPPDEESMRYWTAEVERADALLFGRVTYEMMKSAWRQPARGTWA